MKVLIYCCLLIAGMFAGYVLRTFNETDAPSKTFHSSNATSVTTSCNLPNDQVELIANQLAPLLLKHIANTNINTNSNGFTTPQQANQKLDVLEKERDKKSVAMNKANDLVDRMLASRSVDQETLSQAVQLLEESGQAQEAYKLNAKIAAAINRGEIKPEDAGFAPHQ